MLEPIIMKLFFFTIFLIKNLASFDQEEIFPLVNLPDDFPCPEYSSVRNPVLFLTA